MIDMDKYRGAMLGLAVGDALGAPVEGLKAGHIQQLYGQINGMVDPGVAWTEKPHRWRLRGLYSDDTQQALALADSLVKCRGFNPGHFKSLLVKMARAETGAEFGAHRGTGKNFRASVRSLMDGADESGSPSAGMGAMMRSAPCGLYFAGEIEATARAAIEQGLVTHRDPRALVMAAVLACAVGAAATGQWSETDPAGRMADLVEWGKMAESIVEKDCIHRLAVSGMDRLGLGASGLSLLPRLLDLPEEKMVWRQILGEANRQFPEHKITEPGQGFVMAGGLSALYLGAASTSYEDGVRKAVHLGKDTDTMAAVAGSILGARLGEDAIPREWRSGLVNGDQVALRGEALFRKSAEGLGLRDLVSMEAELTRQEQEEREKLLAKIEPKAAPKPAAQKSEEKPAGQKPPPGARERRGKRQKQKRVKAPWKR